MLKILLTIGLLGSFIMYLGDIFLYFANKEINRKDPYPSIYAIMKELPATRLKIGGILGLFASFLGSIGAFHIYYLSENAKPFALATSLVLMFSFIAGGMYHSHWPYFGLMAKTENEEAFNATHDYIYNIRHITYIAFALANLLLVAIILIGWTTLPQIAVLITPIAIYALLPLLRKLPQPYYVLIVHGWGNLPFVIYYTLLLVWFSI